MDFFIVYLVLALVILVLLFYLVIVPFLKGVKEGIERNKVKKELIKKFEE